MCSVDIYISSQDVSNKNLVNFSKQELLRNAYAMLLRSVAYVILLRLYQSRCLSSVGSRYFFIPLGTNVELSSFKL